MASTARPVRIVTTTFSDLRPPCFELFMPVSLIGDEPVVT